MHRKLCPIAGTSEFCRQACGKILRKFKIIVSMFSSTWDSSGQSRGEACGTSSSLMGANT